MSEDGERVLASYATHDNRRDRQLLTAWRIAGGDVAWSIAAAPTDAHYTFFHVLPTGLVVLADWYGHVRLLDGKTGRVLRTIDLPRDAFQDLLPSPDGKNLVAVLRSRNALLLDTETLTERGELESNSAHGAVFSNNGELLFMTSSGTLRLFEVATRRLLMTQTDADFVLADPRHDRIVLLPYRGAPRLLNTEIGGRARDNLQQIARCRVPYALQEGQVVSSELPADCPNSL